MRLNEFGISDVIVALIALVALSLPAMAVYAARQDAPPVDMPANVQMSSDVVFEDSSRYLLSPAEAADGFARKLLPANVKTLLSTPQGLEHGEYVWKDVGIADGPLVIWINLQTQMISAFRDGHEIGTAVVVYGVDDKQTPIGKFPIRSKFRDYHSRSYDAPMPYSMFITTDGVALHGSPMSARRATHGCIGLPLNFAKLLFDAASKGDEVHVVRTDPAVTREVVPSAVPALGS